MAERAILCVDDEPVIIESLRYQLRDTFSEEFLLEFAGSGDEALEIVEELEEDEIHTVIIVTDWLMPHMKGDELLRQLHAKFPNVYKIMLTGQADDDAIEKAREAGCLNFLIRKPWNENELVDAIKRALAEQNGVEA